MNHQRLNMIITKTYFHLERDFLLFALSNLGFLKIYVKGGAYSKKRFSGGVLEPPNYIEAELEFKNKFSDTSITYLKEAKLLQSFDGIRQSYEKLDTLWFILNLINQLPVGLYDHTKIFNLLGLTCSYLSKNIKMEELTLLKQQFIAKFLYIEGLLNIEQDEELAFLIRKKIGCYSDTFYLHPKIENKLMRLIHQRFLEK